MTPATIGPYKVLRELGRGGMGEVYLAHDTRLERMVAVKALPGHLASDPDRLARFQREAKVLASLNHPCIGAIYGLEESGGQQYLILEFVEGETLADRLARGRIPVDDAITFARHIAEALEAAHEKGVVHRDLKPSNVMVAPDGGAKVLDFGLARAEGSLASNIGAEFSPDSPTVTRPSPVNSPTIPGAIMGSAGYMSPEQARGRPVDKRTDVFSFGCVLYEMLTGEVPFMGDTVADAIGATLHKDISFDRLPASTPPRIRELLTLCLAKDRKQRLHDMGDARIAIDRALSSQEWSASVADGRSGGGWRLAALIAPFAACSLGIGWVLASRFGAPAAPAPQGAKLLIPSRTSAYRLAGNPAISPDGRMVAFLAFPTGGQSWSLWVRPIDSFEARLMADTSASTNPFWSHDSRTIGFQAEGKLWAVDVEQGGSRRLITSTPGISSGAWSNGGTILLSNDAIGGGLGEVPASGGKVAPVTTLDGTAFERGHHSPTFLPDGQRYLYLVIDRKPEQEVNIGHLYAGRLGSPERTFITDLTSAAWYVRPGWLVYVEDGAIRAAPFDDQSLKVTGDAVTIGDGVEYFRPTGASSLSVASNGTLVFTPPEEDNQLVWFDTNGARLGAVRAGGNPTDVRISPDGSAVLVTTKDRRTGLSDVWMHGLDRTTSTRLTTAASWEGAPLWSRDGSMVYYSSDARDYPEIYSILSDGSDARLVYGATSDGQIWFPFGLTPDGRSLIMMGSVEKLGTEMRLLPLDGSSPATPLRSSPADESAPTLSPDGKWLAYVSNESGRSEVYLAPFPGPGPKVQISVGGSLPRWSPSSDRVYFKLTTAGNETMAGGAKVVETAKLMAVELATPAAFTSPPPPRVVIEALEGIDSFDVAPDGKRLLLALTPSGSQPMCVILNALPPKR